jgi:hypothetical protein
MGINPWKNPIYKEIRRVFFKLNLYKINPHEIEIVTLSMARLTAIKSKVANAIPIIFDK